VDAAQGDPIPGFLRVLTYPEKKRDTSMFEDIMVAIRTSGPGRMNERNTSNGIASDTVFQVGG